MRTRRSPAAALGGNGACVPSRVGARAAAGPADASNASTVRFQDTASPVESGGFAHPEPAVAIGHHGIDGGGERLGIGRRPPGR